MLGDYVTLTRFLIRLTIGLNQWFLTFYHAPLKNVFFVSTFNPPDLNK